MRPPFTTPNGVTIHYFGALALRSIEPSFYFQAAQFIYVGSHEYDLVRWSPIESKRVTTFFCNEAPLDKRALFNACAYALDLIRNREKNIVFLCDGGQHRSKIAAQLVALTLGSENLGVCEWYEVSQADIDFFVKLKDLRFPEAIQEIAYFLE